MKIFISEVDRQNARRVALKNIARFFGIQDWENKPNDMLMEEIKNIDNSAAKSITKLLESYFSSYDDWFNFYQARKSIEMEEDKEYILNAGEQLELQGLIDEREKTLADLQSKFDELRLRQFNRNHFGNDINGIID